MAKPEFDDLVKQLADDNPKKRSQACKKLGSLDNPAAIPHLVRLYDDDPDKTVQAAAQQALEKYKKEHQKLLKTRARASAPPIAKRLQQARVGLGALFGVLLILNIAAFALAGGDDSDNGGGSDSQTPTERDVLLGRISDGIIAMNADSLALSEEWGKVGQGRIDCSRQYERPQPLELSRIDSYTYPDIETIINIRYNSNMNNLNLVLRNWDLACRNDGASVTVEDANLNNQILSGILDSIPGLQSGLQSVRQNPVPTRDPNDFDG